MKTLEKGYPLTIIDDTNVVTWTYPTNLSRGDLVEALVRLVRRRSTKSDYISKCLHLHADRVVLHLFFSSGDLYPKIVVSNRREIARLLNAITLQKGGAS